MNSSLSSTLVFLLHLYIVSADNTFPSAVAPSRVTLSGESSVGKDVAVKGSGLKKLTYPNFDMATRQLRVKRYWRRSGSRRCGRSIRQKRQFMNPFFGGGFGGGLYGGFMNPFMGGGFINPWMMGGGYGGGYCCCCCG